MAHEPVWNALAVRALFGVLGVLFGARFGVGIIPTCNFSLTRHHRRTARADSERID